MENLKLSERFMYYSGLLVGMQGAGIVDDLKHILDLLDAEEQGLLLRLPCKVGDKVYYPDKNWCRVFEYSVVSVAKDSTNIWIRCGNGYSFIYGREIFTTLAEAEKKLAEMGE